MVQWNCDPIIPDWVGGVGDNFLV